MAKYWLDADVMIQAKNGLYSFEMAAPFWAYLEERAEAGVISSSTMIRKEILSYEDKKDPLAVWVKNRKGSPLFCEPGSEVQKKYREIVDFVSTRYNKRQAAVAEFLRGGDCWIIAHAKCAGGAVVSHENRVVQESLRPKIPNVCTEFGVRCISLPEMLRELKFRFKG